MIGGIDQFLSDLQIFSWSFPSSFPTTCPVEFIDIICYFVLRTSFVTAERHVM